MAREVISRKSMHSLVVNNSRSKARIAMRESVSPIKYILFGMLGAYLLVAAASVSSGVSANNSFAVLKYLRIALLLCCGALSITWFRMPRMNSAGFGLLLLTSVYWFAGAWSSSPIWALAYKGLFFASVIAGACMACAIRNGSDLLAFCRSMTAAALVGLILVLMIVMWELGSAPIFVHGRLGIMGINANILGQTASIYGVISFFHWTIEKRDSWKWVSLSVFILMLLMVILTGSRGALALCCLGTAVQIPTISKQRRTQVILYGIALVTMLAIGYFVVNDTGGEVQFDNDSSSDQWEFRARLWSEGLKDTRSGIWRYAIRLFTRNPLIGIGWLHYGKSWGTVQSSYLQVLVEAGMLGGILCLVFLYKATTRMIMAVKRARKSSDALSSLTFLCSGLLVAILLHAGFESSAFVGTTPNSFLLSFCVFHLDMRMDMGRSQEVSRRVRKRRLTT